MITSFRHPPHFTVSAQCHRRVHAAPHVAVARCNASHPDRKLAEIYLDELRINRVYQALPAIKYRAVKRKYACVFEIGSSIDLSSSRVTRNQRVAVALPAIFHFYLFASGSRYTRSTRIYGGIRGRGIALRLQRHLVLPPPDSNS